MDEPQYRETAEDLFDDCVTDCEEAALSLIQALHESHMDPDQNLAYHNRDHTRTVTEQTWQILDVLHGIDPAAVTERDMQIGRVAATFHDAKQNWKFEPVIDGDRKKLMRRRATDGSSEESSIFLAIEYMRTINDRYALEIFTEADMQLVFEGIRATITKFDLSHGTVVQPHLTRTSSHVARALALADINTSGLVGAAEALFSTFALFEEENVDIARAVRNPEIVLRDEWKYYKTRILGWVEKQTKLIAGRKKLFENEIRGFPEKSIPAVTNLFWHFDGSIETVRVLLEDLSSKSPRNAVMMFFDPEEYS